MSISFKIVKFDNRRHRRQVITLWESVFGYDAAHNLPQLAIDKKRAVKDGLFWIAADGENVVGTIMAGYDGHRGWIYSMAVAAERRNAGIGSALLATAEAALVGLGCLKVNLQIMADNAAVAHFYRRNGYRTEQRISMGKAL